MPASVASTITQDGEPAGPVSAGCPIGFDISVTNSRRQGRHGRRRHRQPARHAPASMVASTRPSPAARSAAPSATRPRPARSPAWRPTRSQGPIHVSERHHGREVRDIDNTGHFTTGNDGSGSAPASVVDCPNVTVAKTPDGGTVQAGDPAVFTIKVWNIGPGTATSVSLTTTCRPATSGRSAAPNAASCSIATAAEPGRPFVRFGDLRRARSRPPRRSPSRLPRPARTAPSSRTRLSVEATNEPNSCQYTANNSDDGSIDVLCGNVVILKTANPAGPVSAGEEIGFDVTVDEQRRW